jgi:hypothetical protein
MQQRLTIEGKNAKQLILDQPPEDKVLKVINNTQDGFFAIIFWYLLFLPLNIIFKTIIFLPNTLLTFIKQYRDWQDYEHIHNKNLYRRFQIILNILSSITEVVGVGFSLLGMAKFPLVSPSIFTTLSLVKLLTSFSKMAYYGIKTFLNILHNKKLSQEYNSNYAEFRANLKGTLISAVISFSMVTVFLLPSLGVAIAPALTVIGIVATAGLLTGLVLSNVPSLIRALKNRHKPSIQQLPEDPAPVPLKLKLSPEQLKMYQATISNKNQMQDHYGDLFNKLDLVIEEKGPNSAKGYLLDLIAQESKCIEKSKGRIGNNYDIKLMVLGYVTNLIEKGKCIIGDTKIKSVNALLIYLKGKDYLDPAFTSYFETVGGMQKILALTEHYFNRHEVQVANKLIPESYNMFRQSMLPASPLRP